MTYPQAFKDSDVKVSPEGSVSKRGWKRGFIVSHFQEGAKSPKGMTTNCVWRSFNNSGDLVGTFSGKVGAIESLVQ